MHDNPLALQAGAPQIPPLQVAAQHWEPAVHDNPLALQAGAPQIPPLQVAAQHCEALVHERPSALHVGAPQAPAVHAFTQQSDAYAQALPLGWQLYGVDQLNGGKVRQGPGMTNSDDSSFRRVSALLDAEISPAGVRVASVTVITPS